MSSARISFDIANPQTPDAGAVIYISTDADKWGRLVVTLTNPSTDNTDIKLEPGGALKIYFEMLTAADIKNIVVPAASGWAGGPDTNNHFVSLQPTSEIKIPSGQSTTIELHHVLGHAPANGKFRLFYDSLGIRNVPIQGFVQATPEAKDKPWGLAWLLEPRADYQNQNNTIYVTPAGKPDISNYLLLQIYHDEGSLPSKGKPQLSFSFMTGDGDAALCSEDQLKAVAVSIQAQEPNGRWQDPQKNTQGEDTVWTIETAAGGSDLFSDGGSEGSFLELRFDNIVTGLPPGPSAMLFVHHTSLTGYADGHFDVPVLKVKPVLSLRSFFGTSYGKNVESGATIDYGALKLEWNVIGADEVVLRDVAAGPSSDKTFKLNDSTTVQAVTADVSYALIPRVDGVDQAAYGIDFAVAPPAAQLWITGLATANWTCTSGGYCTLLQDGKVVADNLPLTGTHDVTAPADNQTSKVVIQCHGTTVGTAQKTIFGWLRQCQENILKLGPDGRMCDNPSTHCSDASSYLANVCNCQPPFDEPCIHRAPGCCPYEASSPVPSYDRTGMCFCCCGNSITAPHVAMVGGRAKAAHEVGIGEPVRVALDAALARWSERPVRFSAGIGANPANPMIEIDIGEGEPLQTMLATRHQLFLTPGGLLKRAARLAPGKDALVRPDGTTVPILAMRPTKALRGVHHVATSDEPATEVSGHLIVINDIVCGDYALQLSDLDSVRPELMAEGHAELPEFGSDEYAAHHQLVLLA